MRYLKKINDSFSSDEDEDDYSVAMNEMSSNEDAFIGFVYGNFMIKSPNEISDLVRVYKETYESEKEWSGGPTNSKFREFFKKNYEVGKPQLKLTYKPNIGLLIPTRYGSAYLSYSAISKKTHSVKLGLVSMSSLMMGKEIVTNFEDSSNYMSFANSEDSNIVHHILKISESIYNKNMSLMNTISYLDLHHITNQYPKNCFQDIS